MKNLIYYSIAFAVVFLFPACGTKKEKASDTKTQRYIHSEYRATVTKQWDLIKTTLYLEPDFAKREIKGRALLRLKPHFHRIDTLVLDAKFMGIEGVSLVLNAGKPTNSEQLHEITLNYTYDSLKLHIVLDRAYSKEEEVTLMIRYTARPEQVKAKGSAAITAAKGVYFINHDGSNPDLPVQMWTQGETEAASCWFPTIDAPNQKTKQEIHVKVDKKFKTISNGALVSSTADSLTRTDVWVQENPHSPYLFALVIGDFAEIKDYYKQMPVNYYVEKEYESYAKEVFGNTPEMIDFFGKILKVPYAWDKYHQVVVREFVSGAMENTGCVVHFDALQHNHRQHLDQTYENVVSHELFHHWFGDLVTCESWSNLPLNESFATYGEYLWDEYKYGRDQADVSLKNFQETFRFSDENESVPMIRHDYEYQEDMFDANSYHKGGAVLHMLRKYTGDEVFFASLNLYLNRHRFGNAELSDLRKCFEEVSGEDLNWFFTQWFIQKGMPVLDVKIRKESQKVIISVEQKGEFFRLPFDVEVRSKGVVKKHRFIMEKMNEEFEIKDVSAADAVIFDSENQLLAKINLTQEDEMWKNQFRQSSLAKHRMQAFEHLLNSGLAESDKSDMIMNMLNQRFYACRSLALEFAGQVYNQKKMDEAIIEKVKTLALNDSSSDVRKHCPVILLKNKDEETLRNMLGDSSYVVLEYALLNYCKLNKEKAMQRLNEMRNTIDPQLGRVVLTALSLYSDKDETSYLTDLCKVMKGQFMGKLTTAAITYYSRKENTGHFSTYVNSLRTMEKNSESREGRNAAKVLKNLESYISSYIYYYEEMKQRYPAGKNYINEQLESLKKLKKVLEK